MTAGMLIRRRRIVLGSQVRAGVEARASSWEKASRSQARATIRHQIRFWANLNRPGFDGGSDDTEGSLSWDRRSTPMSCASELRGRALEALADPARARGAIRRIAEELGVHPEAVCTWVKKAQIDQGARPGTTTDEAQRIKEREKEVRPDS